MSEENVNLIGLDTNILFFDFEQNLVLNLFYLDEQFLGFNFNFYKYFSRIHI